MATPDQLRTLVRFGLEQMRVRNAHHDFEHLCRHVARARICSNIIPSTGPVSAGGDQGRDFETFRTYVNENPANHSIFAGLASSTPLAFACTIQAEQIEGKIRADVTTICKSSLKVSGVYVFIVPDLVTAKRHALQEWAKETFGVDLVVYDGNAISELLVDPETFWIASRYLDIPAEQFPERTEETWYEELATTVRQRPRACRTDGEFFELKRLVRHATSSPKLTSDLPEFIARLETVDEKDGRLWRAAIYEVFVASLRGLGSLEGYEQKVGAFFAYTAEVTSAAELHDAACLLNYCAGARAQHLLSIEVDCLVAWRARVVDRVEELLAEAASATAKCALLDVLWYLAISPTPGAKGPPLLDAAFPSLERLADNVVGAKLFPLSSLIDNLTELQAALHVEDTRRYQQLTVRFDTVLAEREGDQAVAEKSRDRAFAFLKSRMPLVALKFIHDANVKWFSHETLKGSLLTQLLLAEVYESLGLCKAAQYFALGQAHLAVNSELPGVRAMASRGLFAASKSAYHAGEWLRCVEFADAALRVHTQFTPEPGNVDRHPGLMQIGFSSGAILAILKQLGSPTYRRAQRAIVGWKLGWVVDDMVAEASKARAEFTVDETWRHLERQLWGRPLGDAGNTRHLQWRALGIRWRFRWLNKPNLAAAAEQLVACLQVVLADLAEDDLCLLPSTVTARIQVGAMSVVDEPSNRGSRWTITIPADLGVDDTVIACLGVVGEILHNLSTLPSSRFVSILKQRFKSGLSSKVFIARPYAELFSTFIPDRAIRAARRAAPAQAKRRFRMRQHRALAWNATLGPFYPNTEIETWLKNRYSRLVPPIRGTVAALAHHQPFQAILESLRRSGWRDWHVLNAIYAVALNSRADAAAGMRSPAMLAKLRDDFDKSDGLAVDDLALFTEERLRQVQFLNMLSTMKILGHEVHQRTPSLKAIQQFLATRYRYFEDDIDHEDPFAA